MTLFTTKIYFAFILSMLSAALLSAQTVLTFDTPGAGTFTVPCGVTSVTITIWGGGGGGGGGSSTSSGGSGGGGGANVTGTFPVVAGAVINFNVGSGGTAGAAAGGTGGAGGATTVTGAVTMSAAGGGGGVGNGGAAGVGGNTGIGGTLINGANGVVGSSGLGGNGGNAGGVGGGTGGAGGSNNIGSPGSAPGGGGGGGERSGGTSLAGGAGGAGRVRITYISTITQPNAGADFSGACSTTLNGNFPDLGWSGTWSCVSGGCDGVVFSNPNSPSSSVSGFRAGGCTVLRWTFSQAGCADVTDEVNVCAPATCNDEPCGASALDVSTDGFCYNSVFTLTGNTVSTGMTEPGCGNFTAAGRRDVWMTAEVPASGFLIVQAIDGPSAGANYPAMSLYTGTCSDLTHEGCASTTSTGISSQLTYIGTPGETVYIRVHDYINNTGDFNICAGTFAVTPGDVFAGNTTVNCGSSLNFTDPGGSGNYPINSESTYRICPSVPGQFVSVSFATFSLENNFDFLNVMDGGTVDAPYIATYTGATLPPTITSSAADGCLTFSFLSDDQVSAAGWTATISCSPTAGSNTTVCSGTNCNGECGLWICTDGTYPTDNAVSVGINDIGINSGACQSAGEVSSKWYYFTVLTSGTIGITFDGPNGQDYDYSIYGPSMDGNPPCPSVTGQAPIRCSFSAAANPIGLGTNPATGIVSTDQYEGAEGDGWVAPLTVQAGETYAMLMNIFQTGGPQPIIDMDITGTGTLDCSVLDVAISSFNGINQGAKNLLFWTTQSESNNDHFILESSLSGENWQEVGKVPGAGNTQAPRYYQLPDLQPYFPITYYRLKQVDYDGSYTYSKVISISGERATGEIVSDVYPNPATDLVSFSFHGSEEGPMTLKVVNELGQLLHEQHFDAPQFGNTYSFNSANLPAGIYFLSFKQGAVQKNQKLVIRK